MKRNPELFVCARCRRTYAKLQIRRCYEPNVNKVLGECICYYCCKRCKYHTEHPMCGAIGCEYNDSHRQN